MDDVIAPRRNNEPRDLGTFFPLDLSTLSLHDQDDNDDDDDNNILIDEEEEAWTLDPLCAALEATTTLQSFAVVFSIYDRRVVEPLCRCIANLRRHNPNHPLRRLEIQCAKKEDGDDVNQLLLAAKQFGRIHQLALGNMHLPIQSLVEFCQDNTHLKVLILCSMALLYEDTAITVSQQDAGSQVSSANLTLDQLQVCCLTLENSGAATTFLNLMRHVTYPSLRLGNVTVVSAGGDSEKTKKDARMRIVAALIKPSVEELLLNEGCRIENIDVIEACTTVTQIRIYLACETCDFSPAVIRQLLQTIVTRNRELARFRANASAYPHNELLKLMLQLDNNPTGRFMLARCLPEIPSFFYIKSTDSCPAKPKK